MLKNELLAIQEFLETIKPEESLIPKEETTPTETPTAPPIAEESASDTIPEPLPTKTMYDLKVLAAKATEEYSKQAIISAYETVEKEKNRSLK